MDQGAFYHDGMRRMQERAGARELAGILEFGARHDAMTPEEVAVVSTAEFFFIASCFGDRPDVSFKAGPKGFVSVLSPGPNSALTDPERLKLLAKYSDEAVAEAIIDGGIWHDMTKEQLLDSWARRPQARYRRGRDRAGSTVGRGSTTRSSRRWRVLIGGISSWGPVATALQRSSLPPRRSIRPTSVA